MSNAPSYPAMQRMLNQLNKPFPNVSQYMSLNALCMILLLPILFQVEKIAASEPTGYAPVPLIIIVLALGLIVAVIESIIAVVIFSAIGWMMNVPGFFAIGVIRGIEGAEQRYRNVHIGFYRRAQSNYLYSGLALITYSSVGLWSLIGWISSGVYSFSILIGFMIMFAILALSAHIVISFVAKKKREKWEKMSDVQIHNDAELKRQRFPILESVPSVDEMEQILLEAKLGDPVKQSDAKLINQVASREYLKNVIWMIIVFICIVLLFV